MSVKVEKSKNKSLSDDELNEVIALQEEYLKHSQERTFENKDDVKFYKKVDSSF